MSVEFHELSQSKRTHVTCPLDWEPRKTLLHRPLLSLASHNRPRGNHAYPVLPSRVVLSPLHLHTCSLVLNH